MKSNTIQIILIVLAVILVIGAFAVITKDKDTPDDGILGGTDGGGTDIETNSKGETDEAPKETGSSDETEKPAVPCNHVYGSATVVREATCDTVGLKVSTCTKCGAVNNETIPAHGSHTYNSYLDSFEGCEKVRNYICGGCGHVKTESLNVYVHNYSGGECLECGITDPNYTPDSGEDDDSCPDGHRWLYGSCRVCGISCSHSDTKTTYHRNETGCEPYDEVYCDTCGEMVDQYALPENHADRDGDGICACQGDLDEWDLM